MSQKVNYQQLAETIIKNVGGVKMLIKLSIVLRACVFI